MSGETITDAEDIVMLIMTQHWGGMAACRCWICEAGRALGLHPTSDYLDWREMGYGYVTMREAL